MTTIKLAGVTFCNLPHIEVGDEVTIRREKTNPQDSDNTPALAVMLEGCKIGYVPRIETVKAKYMEAKQGDNPPKAQMLFEELNNLEFARDNIRCDMECNHITPAGRVASLRWLGEDGWNGDGDGELKSISIALDYM